MQCPECNGKLVEGRGYMVCESCGLETDQIIDNKNVPIQRYDPYGGLDRGKAPVVHWGKSKTPEYPDINYQTYVDEKDIYNVKITHSPLLRRAFRRERHFKQNFYRENQIRINIKRICSQLNIREYVRKQCVQYMFELLDSEVLKGYYAEYISATIIYVSCRMNQLPITLKDFENIGLDKQKIHYYIKILSKQLNLKLPPQNLDKLIVRYLNELVEDEALNIVLIKECLKIAQKIKPEFGSTRLWALGIIFKVIKPLKYITLKDFTIAFGTSPQTIRNFMKKIIKK